MLKKAVIVVGVLVVGFVAVVAVQPSHYEIQRSLIVAASRGVVYDQLVDFRRWDAWSPWAKLDPAMMTRFSGAAAGVGAVYEWLGNEEVGRGRMTVTAAMPRETLEIGLEFFEPMTETATTTFRLLPAGAGTQVVWTMTGDSGLVGKVFRLFVDVDARIGADLERGLANLKAVSEAQVARAALVTSPAR